MTPAQISFLLQIAQAKLSEEAVHPDLDLRQIVGHALLVDNMRKELAEAAQRAFDNWHSSFDSPQQD